MLHDLLLWYQVDWTQEQPCFEGVSSQIASFYCVQPGMYIEEDAVPSTVDETVEEDGKKLSTSSGADPVRCV